MIKIDFMKRFLPAIIVCLVCAFNLSAQKIVTPDLSKINNTKMWSTHNRTSSFKDVLFLGAGGKEGLARFNELVFENGKIELDIKGKDEQGKSVGLRFGLEMDRTDILKI